MKAYESKLFPMLQLSLHSKHLPIGPIVNGHCVAPGIVPIASSDHGNTGHTKVGASGLLLLHRLLGKTA